MGPTPGDDAAELKKRAERLRDCAREARAPARRLGPYLDDAVKKATPRAAAFRTGGDEGAIWQGLLRPGHDVDVVLGDAGER
ncbi:hypothetical protein [Streptomyces variegatus]|uniref:hypothetical protein n=1 Tax=Streptomyces variegatus TaxID=284040 RepID=UPI000B3137D0|nr:hypothetical protein [Streptomyces variegatus]